MFHQYVGKDFGATDLARLAELMSYINEVGAAFVVSFAWSAEGARLAHGWNARRYYVQRNISGFAHHRRRAAELLISNREIHDA
jgi:DNA adenine methylase